MNLSGQNQVFKGTSLIQYIIIIALIALVLVPILFFMGQYLVANFSNFSNCFSNSNTVLNSGPKIKAGELNGTPDKPVAKCTDNLCSIDYGSFVLNGIPQNFDEFVQTGGTSGGEDKLADIIMQIAKQLKDQGDIDGYEDFKKFANLTHISADIIRVTENKIKSGENPQSFLSNNLNGDLNYNIPAELSAALPQINLNHSYSNVIISSCDISSASHELNPEGNPSLKDPGKNSNNTLSYAIVDIFNTIQSKEDKYPESLRNLTQELYLNYYELQSNCVDHLIHLSIPTSTNNDSYVRNIDPITGKDLGSNTNNHTDNSASAFLHPQYTLKEDLTGSLICTAGKNQDLARSCH